MKQEIMKVTPKLAELFLSKNLVNRKIDKSVVAMYARDMKAGKWRLTHQGILLGKNGYVIDGQHRLAAIVLSGASVQLLVCIDETYETALSAPVDIGFKRGSNVVLGVSTTLAAVGSLAFRFHKNISKFSALDIEPYVRLFDEPLELLRNKSQSTAKGITQAGLQLAGCARILLGEDLEYIQSVYKAMIDSDYMALSQYPIAASIHKQIVIDRVQLDQRQLFSRSFRVFDQSRRHLTKLLIKDESLAFNEAKSSLVRILDKTI